MFSVRVVEMSSSIRMENEMRHLKHTIFRMEIYIIYVEYIAYHMPNSKPLLSEIVTFLALIEDNSSL